jgi:hypothetical protein
MFQNPDVTRAAKWVDGPPLIARNHFKAHRSGETGASILEKKPGGTRL